jgi:hypothetical protein
MVAAEDEYEPCLDTTEICDETHAEIKELFTELDIAIVNYNQASKNGLPTYEYAEEINAITKDLVELGIEFELQRVIELEAVVEPICPDEFEDLYEEINELLTELDALILSHNEAYKAGNMDAVYEYGQEIDEIVNELGGFGVPVEIERNSRIKNWIVNAIKSITKIGGWKIITNLLSLCAIQRRITGENLEIVILNSGRAGIYFLRVYVIGERHPIRSWNITAECVAQVRRDHPYIG